MASRSGRFLLGLVIGGLLLGGLGFLTAGFTSFDPTEWADRFKPVIPDDDDDPDPDDDDEQREQVVVDAVTYYVYDTIDLREQDYSLKYDKQTGPKLVKAIEFDTDLMHIFIGQENDYDGFDDLIFDTQFDGLSITHILGVDFPYDDAKVLYNNSLYSNEETTLNYFQISTALRADFTTEFSVIKLVHETNFDEAPEESTDPAPQARNIGVKMAYGAQGAQTLTVDVTPANADIDLSFSVDKSQVTVTKTGAKTASVQVSTYYAGYATITVTDAISGISATGKVYSYQKTQLEVIENLAHGLDGEMVISNNANRAVTEDVTAVSYEYLRPPNEQYTPSGQWVYPFETIYIHIAYSGSFAPSLECKNGDQTTYVIANDVASNPGNKVATFAVNIADNSDSSIGGICNIYVYRSPLWTYGGMKLILAKLQLNYAQGVSGMSVPDLTFTD